MRILSNGSPILINVDIFASTIFLLAALVKAEHAILISYFALDQWGNSRDKILR
jgi:hypothetical protein